MERVSCARPAVQTVGDRIEFVQTVDRKVSAFGQVLAQQSVGVFASAALPRAVRVAEETTEINREGWFFDSERRRAAIH
jgi:hypothetical protein